MMANYGISQCHRGAGVLAKRQKEAFASPKHCSPSSLAWILRKASVQTLKNKEDRETGGFLSDW